MTMTQINRQTHAHIDIDVKLMTPIFLHRGLQTNKYETVIKKIKIHIILNISKYLKFYINFHNNRL